MRGLAIALAWLAGSFAPISAAALDVAGRCRVTFFATATLHDFEGKAPCARLAIEPHGESGHYRGFAEVTVAQLDTGIAARNEKMREMFEAERYPVITAIFENIDSAGVRGQAQGMLPFAIEIHGVARGVKATTSGWSEVPDQQRAHFRAEFTVALSDFGMEPPSAVGLVRVGDQVRVVVDVDLTASSDTR